jgi:hypothetical protein
MATTHGTFGDHWRQPLLPLPRVFPVGRASDLADPQRSSVIHWNDFIIMQICPEARHFLYQTSRTIIRMRGLPFQATVDNIVRFRTFKVTLILKLMRNFGFKRFPDLGLEVVAQEEGFRRSF